MIYGVYHAGNVTLFKPVVLIQKQYVFCIDKVDNAGIDAMPVESRIQFFKVITITEATAIGTELREYFWNL